MASSVRARAIILPGNGCTDIRRSNWYQYIESKLIQRKDLVYEVNMRTMPDPYEAKETEWIPFIINDLGVDENTIVIGHSSGAVAALRLLETHKVLGVVLVSVCHTDLGEESERVSGYYSRPWDWNKIRSNAQWIIQYHSEDDPFIPREEADFVASQIQSDYTCFTNKSHFFTSRDVKHMVSDIERKLQL